MEETYAQALFFSPHPPCKCAEMVFFSLYFAIGQSMRPDYEIEKNEGSQEHANVQMINNCNLSV